MKRHHSMFLACAMIGIAGCGSDKDTSQQATEAAAESAAEPALRRGLGQATTDSRFSRILPEAVDPKQREAAESFARQYEESRAQGTFAMLGDEATEEVRTSLTVQKQKDAQQQIGRTFGEFESLKYVEAWRANASPNSTIYRFRATFTKGQPEIRVVHDSRGKVSGFWLKPWRDSLEPPRPQKLPENQVNTALKDASSEFASSYLERHKAGSFEVLGNQATDEMRTALSPETQRRTHAEITTRLGEYRSLIYVETYRLADEPGTMVFRFRGRFSKGQSEIRVTRNAEGKVSGMWIKPWRDEFD